MRVLLVVKHVTNHTQVVIGTALFPLCCFFMRWNTIRVKKAAAAKDAAWQQQMEKEREDPSLLARITTAQRKPA
jgi:hypothetical protein